MSGTMAVTNVRWEGYVAGNALTVGSQAEVARKDIVVSSQINSVTLSGTGDGDGYQTIGSIVVPVNAYATNDVIRVTAFRYANTAEPTIANILHKFLVSGGGTSNAGFESRGLGIAFTSGAGALLSCDIIKLTGLEGNVFIKMNTGSQAYLTQDTFDKTSTNVNNWTPTGTYAIFLLQKYRDAAGSVFLATLSAERDKS